MKFFETKLPNGLTVIGEQQPNAVSTAIGFFVKTGARDETPEVSGVSHFLEHMMFKGTAKRNALEITYEMGAIGAQSNAFTSEENTVYYTQVLPEYFLTALELLSDMMRSSLDPVEFDVEKKVILEEIALYQDRPTFVLFESAMRTFFANHAAGNSVLGSIESITNLTQPQMREYFDRRYSPTNVVLAVAGNFDWQEVLDNVGKFCGHWTGPEAGRDVQKHSPIISSKVLTKDELHRAHMCVVAPGPSATDPARFPASVLACILGDSQGSRVYWELIDKGLVDSASIEVDDMDGAGMVYGFVSSSVEQIDEVGSILTSILKTPANFSDADLERAITKIGTRLVIQGESSMRRLMTIGLDWVYRKQYVTLEDNLRRVQAVTRKSIQELLEQYTFEPTCTVKLVPSAG